MHLNTFPGEAYLPTGDFTVYSKHFTDPKSAMRKLYGLDSISLGKKIETRECIVQLQKAISDQKAACVHLLDGELLAGETPHPPKRLGGLYQAARTQRR